PAAKVWGMAPACSGCYQGTIVPWHHEGNHAYSDWSPSRDSPAEGAQGARDGREHVARRPDRRHRAARFRGQGALLRRHAEEDPGTEGCLWAGPDRAGLAPAARGVT